MKKIVHDQSSGIIPLRKVNNNWEVFLVKNINGHFWGFPKGHANEKESLQNAAVRELREETGLQVEKMLFSDPIEESYTFFHKGNEVRKKVYYFVASVKGSISLEDKEIEDGKWFFFDQALSILTYEESKRVFVQVKEKIS